MYLMHCMESKAAFEKKLDKKSVLNEFQRRVEYLVQTDGHNQANAYSKARKQFRDIYFPTKPSGAGDITLPPWCNLNKQSFSRKQSATTRHAVDWAIENVAFRNVKSKDAPNATAWLYLQRFRADPVFLNEVLKKRVPTVSKIESSKGFGDDGRKHFKLIDKLKAELTDQDANPVLSPGPKTDQS